MNLSSPFIFVSSPTRAALVLFLGAFAAACGPPQAAPTAPVSGHSDERFGLSFEERMALPAELSRLKADAARRADEMYDPFKSRENAIRNEEMARRLFTESKVDLLNRNGLNEAQLDEIVHEYQTSMGAVLR